VLRQGFLRTQKYELQMKKTDKVDLVKIISLGSSKDTKTMKIQDMDWEKIFANHISNKRIIFKIYTELL
jgi:hypothetical protein